MRGSSSANAEVVTPMAVTWPLQRLERRRGACVVIAVKERFRCKTRLAGALSPTARLGLVRSMLATVLAAAGRAQTVREIVVLSPERDTVPAEIPVLADTGEGLNVALTQAVRVFGTSGYDELVILPADLPSVCAGDIDALVRAGRQGGFAIAPDAADVGTNALCLVSPTTFQFQFGRNSMQLHLKESRRWGLSSQILRRPGLQFDVDLPDDLQQVHELWHPRLQG